MRRTAVVLLSALFSIITLGCGGDKSSKHHDLGSDLLISQDGSAAEDASPGPDSSLVGIQCGSMTCSIGSTCCVVPNVQNQTAAAMCISGSQCADAGIPATCDGPEDCPQSDGNCCVDLMLGSQNQLSGHASCTSSCRGSVTASGTGDTLKTKLCHSPADCAGYRGATPLGAQDFNDCCSFQGSYPFCAPAFVTASLSGVHCDRP